MREGLSESRWGWMKVAQEPRSPAGKTPASGHKTETEKLKSGLMSRILDDTEPGLKSGKMWKISKTWAEDAETQPWMGPGAAQGQARMDRRWTGLHCAFVSSLPIFQPQTTGALLPENARSQSVAELGLFPCSWPFPKDKEEKLPLPPQILPEGPASAGRIRSGNFWSQEYSLGRCCRE